MYVDCIQIVFIILLPCSFYTAATYYKQPKPSPRDKILNITAIDERNERRAQTSSSAKIAGEEQLTRRLS